MVKNLPKIVLFLIFSFTLSYSSEIDSLYSRVQKNFPNDKPFPVSMFPAFMLSDSIQKSFKTCNLIWINRFECNYYQNVNKITKKVIFSTVSKNKILYRMFFYVLNPINNCWTEYRDPIVVRVTN